MATILKESLEDLKVRSNSDQLKNQEVMCRRSFKISDGVMILDDSPLDGSMPIFACAE